MTIDEICYEYEQVITERRATYSSEIFDGKSGKDQEKTSIEFIKVVLEKYLHWTPEESYHYLNKATIENMRLKPLLRYLKFPFEFDINEDCRFIVSKIYPEKFPVDPQDIAREIYQKVVDGKLCRYPKNFFEGREGQMRALFCLKHALSTFKTFSNADELYRFMYEEGKTFLKEYKLWDAYVMNYGESPLDYLHDSFNDKIKEKFQPYYDKYKNIEAENENKKEEKKTKNNI